MARIHHVQKAQQRYYTVPVLNEDGTQKTTPVMRKNGTPKLTKRGTPVILRITANDPTRPKANLRCGNCGTEILPGMPYKWVAVKSGPYGGRTLVRCKPCPSWKPSELTSSNRAVAMAAIEAAEADISNWTMADGVDMLEEIVQGAAEGIQEYADMCRESASNMEEGFGHPTYLSEELEQKAEDLEYAANELSSWSFSGEAEDLMPYYITIDGVEQEERFETEEQAEESAGLLRIEHEDLDETLIAVEYDDTEPDWVEEARDEALNALQEVELG